MAGLRGSKQLWGTAAAGATVAAAGTSAYAVIGAQNNVVVYIANSGGVDATFTVQVSSGAPGNAPGQNALTNDADGGIDWYDYTGAEDISVPAGSNVAFDLSPFGPQFIRLLRSDAAGNTTVSAFVTSESD